MIDPKYQFFGNTINYLPQIVKHSASNQIHISNLYLLIQNYEMKYIERAQIFTSALFFIQTLPMVYICGMNLVQGQKIEDMNLLFVVQSCYTFGTSLFYIIELLQYGVSANQIDELFKGEVMEVRMDMVKLRVNSNSNQIYLTKDKTVADFIGTQGKPAGGLKQQAHILIPRQITDGNGTPTEVWKSLNGEVFHSLDGFDPVSEQMDEHLQVLDQSTTQVIEQIDYLQEHGKYKFLYFDISQELMNSLLTFVGGMIIAVLQKENL